MFFADHMFLDFIATGKKKNSIPMSWFGFGQLLLYSFLVSVLGTSSALETISPSQSLRDGDTLISANQTFVLGFFSFSDPRIRYLGIWYKKISTPTIVWVANRETPLFNSSGALNISSQGNLVLYNATNHILWSSNESKTTAKDPVARLLDSGNLVVRDDSNPENLLWQSFDHPADTLLPGMKLGGNLLTGLDLFLSSWKSSEDPAQGQFSLRLNLNGYPQLVLRKGTSIQFRAGSWNGEGFMESPVPENNPIFTNEFVFNENEAYFRYRLKNLSIVSMFSLNPSGLAQRFIWNDQTNDWMFFASARLDLCENYALCGANSNCDASKSPVCECLDGFTPKSPRDWNLEVWSDGCVRRTPLDCSNKDGFLKCSAMKLPDTSASKYNRSIDLEECRNLCLRNCSCTAYANLDIRRGGSGCLLWFNNLIDMRLLESGGQDLYVRVAASELDQIKKRPSSLKAGIIIGSTILGIIIMLFLACIRRRNLRKHRMAKIACGGNGCFKGVKEDMDLPLFSLTTISEATDNFSSSNKLGEGGFGPVYKGAMKGQEIAVKRLSKSSGQGLIEFKNEVILIAKLQHRNLVRVLGCCIHGKEKILVYEFMPNKSLDFFIFDETRSKLLNWHKRNHIIDGIARGLLYLHQDSRLRIIHRDLKASNILLDNDMNPKISDFGLARTFMADQTEAKTKRIVGTHGYMSPEYAVDGLFSLKSDVFSFGVLVLEILSAKKNRGFCHPDHDLNLLGHAWMLWIKGTPLELMDKSFTHSYNLSQVVRCINVALLCVQQRPEDRPNMSSVVVMLSSENPLPQPKQPGFFMLRNPPEADISPKKHQSHSANEVTMTLFEPR